MPNGSINHPAAVAPTERIMNGANTVHSVLKDAWEDKDDNFYVSPDFWALGGAVIVGLGMYSVLKNRGTFSGLFGGRDGVVSRSFTKLVCLGAAAVLAQCTAGEIYNMQGVATPGWHGGSTQRITVDSSLQSPPAPSAAPQPRPSGKSACIPSIDPTIRAPGCP